MRNDLDKKSYKDLSNTIKTAIEYPLELALDKISHVNFYKLKQNTKRLIISGRLCFPLTQNLISISSTHNNLHLLRKL